MLSSFGSIKSHPPADSSLQSGERHWVDSTVECLTDSSNIDTVGWWIPSLCDWELRAVWWVTVTVSNPSSISGSLLTLAGVAQSHSVHQHPPRDVKQESSAVETGLGRREAGGARMACVHGAG